jgi:epoxyqueuosine reductase
VSSSRLSISKDPCFLYLLLAELGELSKSGRTKAVRTLFSEEKGYSFLTEQVCMEKEENFQRAKSFFILELAARGYDGVIGAAEFNEVYVGLMSVQRTRLKDICGDHFQDLRKHGSIICIGIAYSEHAIDCIDLTLSSGTVDKDSWNVYATEYHKLNEFLNQVSKGLSDLLRGVLIPATVEGIAVKNVEQYYGMTVSHRVAAQEAGLGWRGKNELIVNERFSCALRFASVATSIPLIHGKKVNVSCQECEACLEACPFLRNKDKLENYRESCRRYIIQLGLEHEVCGKCIKACYRHSIFSNGFRLK